MQFQYLIMFEFFPFYLHFFVALNSRSFDSRIFKATLRNISASELSKLQNTYVIFLLKKYLKNTHKTKLFQRDVAKECTIWIKLCRLVNALTSYRKVRVYR